MRISDWSSDVCSSDLRGWNGIAHEAGPWAIEEYLQSPLDSRFIQSFKSVAASPLFERAMIWGKPFRFEDMGRLFLQRLIAHAGGALDERSEEPTSELQSLIRISYAVFRLNKKLNTSHQRLTEIH